MPAWLAPILAAMASVFIGAWSRLVKKKLDEGEEVREKDGKRKRD